MKRIMLVLFLALSANAAGYHVVRHIPIGGEGGWDYVTVGADHRVYQSHSDRLVVVDPAKGTVVGEILNTPGVHGVALAPELGRGFVSAGRSASVVVFDLKSLKTIAEWKTTGENPDAILYEPKTGQLFTFNGRGHNATVFDAESGKVLETIAMGGKPEFAVHDGGRVYVNVEDTNEIAVIDAKKRSIIARYPIAPCDAPSGLAIDVKHQRLFSVCENEKMVVTNAASGKVVATAPIGKGVDGAAFDPAKGLVFSSNGADGTVTVIREVKPDQYEVIETVPTARGGRTIAVDPVTHHLFVPTAKFGQPAEAGKRPPVLSGTFELIEIAP